MAALISVFPLLLLASWCSASPEALTPLNLLVLTPPGHHVDEASDGGDHDDGGIMAAVQLALDHVNRNCSILENYVLNMTLHSSSKCSRGNGLDALHEGLFDDITPDVAVIGAGCSLATEAVAQQSKYYALPMVSYASIAGTLDNRYQFPFFSRTIPSGDLVAGGVASVIQYYRWKRLVVITENSPEFISMTDRLRQGLEDDVSLFEIMFPSQTTVLEATNFFPDGVRIFVLNVDAPVARWLICNASRHPDLTEHPNRYVWLTQGWYEDRWWEEQGEGPEGANCTADQLLEFLQQQRALAVNHYPSAPHTTAINAEISGGVDDAPTFSALALFAYDAVWTVALALSDTVEVLPYRCGNGSAVEDFNSLDSNLESRRCIATLFSQAINDISFNGFSGMVSFENGSRAVDRVSVLQYRNNDTVPLTESIHILRAPDGEALVFEYAEGETNDTVWPEGIPSDGTQYTTIQRFPYLWLWVMTYIFNSVVILAALFCLIFTFIFRNRKLIKLTSPNLNYIIIAGIVIFSFGAIMFSYPAISDTTLSAYCAIRIWFIAIGTTLCFGMINAKMGRIYYIFHKPQAKKRVIKDWVLCVFVLVMIVIDLIILVPVTAFDSVRFRPNIVPDAEHPGNFTDDSGTFSYVVALCDTPWRLYIIAPLFGYKGAVQIAGIILAILMRNVEIKVLNDSREISLCLYLCSIILLAIIVGSLVFGDHLNIYGLSYCLGVPFALAVLLIVVFFTKMVRLYKDPKGDRIFSSGNVGQSTLTGLGGGGDKATKVMQLEGKVKDLERKISMQAEVKGMESSLSLKNEGGQVVLQTQETAEHSTASYTIIN